ncbi:UNVERIFIED_CONTAM: hypothetical protein O8I53_10340 [Campylobacter lari]
MSFSIPFASIILSAACEEKVNKEVEVTQPEISDVKDTKKIEKDKETQKVELKKELNELIKSTYLTLKDGDTADIKQYVNASDYEATDLIVKFKQNKNGAR